MSEETIIGPGDHCPYCGEVYGQHVPRCPMIIHSVKMPGLAIKTNIPPIIVMKAALAHAILVGADDGAIACLKSAIIHQQQAEAIADELIGIDDSSRDTPQKD